MNKKISMSAGIAVVVIVGLIAIGLIWWNSSSQPEASQTIVPVANKVAQPANTATATNSATGTTNDQAKTQEKVYANKSFGYSLEKPTGWVVDASDSKNVFITSPESQEMLKELAKTYGSQGYTGDYTPDIIISYFDSFAKYKQLSPLQTESLEGVRTGDDLESYINVSKDLDQTLSNVGTISFAGGKAWIADKVSMKDHALLIAEHNKHIYQIGFRNIRKEMTSAEKQIISSFKFDQ